MAANTTATAKQQIILKKEYHCKGSVRFCNKEPGAAINSVYVSRTVPGIATATSVIVTIEPTSLPA